ncbi:hypothetical protein FHS32_000893 [Streptomyces albaduncus]|uniref:Uncharacterized protein n=1 Tax=Streptomyces griseoloalbus TaxID=67303 RepID=A0A7W8BIV6_9ACTN|nr:hypothetical protein [Streptomyces albaduncus]GGV80232.1 hypothetical protein GCM10010294_52080 [Streptomyces griseoloalbus]GGW33076.1 hypothetical protein GCM10010340_08460 [Streptomyces albaduncus]
MESGADSGAGVEGTGADSNGEFLRCFGRQMKLLREATGLTQAQLGERVPPLTHARRGTALPTRSSSADRVSSPRDAS